MSDGCSEDARERMLDAMAGVAYVGAILAHARLPGPQGKLVNDLCSFAVPLLFMVAGYRLHGREKELWGRLMHSETVLVCAFSALFLVVGMFGRGGTPFPEWLADMASAECMARVVMLNDYGDFCGRHLWFLGALAWTYGCLHWLYARFRTRVSNLLPCVPVLLAISVFLGMFVPWMFQSFFLFVGFPYFLAGYWAGRNERFLDDVLPGTPVIGFVSMLISICLVSTARGVDILMPVLVPVYSGSIFLVGLLNAGVRVPDSVVSLGRRDGLAACAVYGPAYVVIGCLFHVSGPGWVLTVACLLASVACVRMARWLRGSVRSLDFRTVG